MKELIDNLKANIKALAKKAWTEFKLLPARFFLALSKLTAKLAELLLKLANKI
jgi:hypothetical protein